MTVNEFANKNSIKVLCLPDGDREIKGGYVGDLLSWVMGRAKEDDAWITIMSNTNVLAVASLADVSCVIFAEGVEPDKDFIETAKQKAINLLSTEKNSFEIAAEVASQI